MNRATERLDDVTIEALQNLGAGPKTVQALKVLGTKSVTLCDGTRPILEQVRQYALNYTGNLPDFICTETTTRSEAALHGICSAPGFHKVDTLTAKLTYFQQHEEYKLKMHNDATVIDGKQTFGGSSSYGGFGTMMKLLFEPSTEARFEWDDWGALRGRRVLKFSYHITRDRSNYLRSAKTPTEALITES